MALVIRTTGLEQFLDSQGESSIKVLILGDPGAGKTRHSAFWPKPFFLSFDKSLASIADLRRPYVTPESTEDIKNVIAMLQIEALKKPEARRFRTVVVDTIDAYQKKVLIPEILKGQAGKLALQGYGDYGQLKAKTSNFVLELMRLPFNVIFNCHTERNKVEGSDTTVVEAAVEGAYGQRIYDDFDLIGLIRYSSKVEGSNIVWTREIRWHPTPMSPMLKDRFGKLPESTPVEFSDNDYVVLFETIFGDHLDSLKPSEVVGEIEDVQPKPEQPTPGGPVPVDEAKAASKAAAAKKTAAPKAAKTTTARRSAGKSETVVAPPPPAAAPPAAQAAPAGVKAPAQNVKTAEEFLAEGPEGPSGDERPSESEAPETMDQAVEVVAGVLGGKVIEEAPKEEPAVVDAPPATGQPERAYPSCGKAVRGPGRALPIEPCGKSLKGEDVNKVNISLLKYGTYLCESCLKKAMAAAA